MDITEIAVDTDILNSDIGELQMLLDSAKLQLDEMFNQIVELNTMWEGAAKEQLINQFELDYSNAKNIIETIESLIECMKYARNQYNSCENEIENLVNSIKI
jgi:uncharacterized protein YukE